MIRRFGDCPDRSRSYQMRPGAYALLPLNGQLLLTCQYEDQPDLQLPGGGIDPGESPLPALYREVYEETGWRIANPRWFGVFRRFAYMPEYDLWAEKVCHIYLARPTRQIGPPTEPDHDVVWMSPDVAARSLGNAGDRYFARLVSRRI